MNEQNEIMEDSEIFLPKAEGSVPSSILAGLVSLVVSLVIISLCNVIIGKASVFPLILFPLLTFLFTKLFGGKAGMVGRVVAIVFSIIGLIISPSFSYACEYCVEQNISLFSIPLTAFSSLKEHFFFKDFSFCSATVLPIAVIIVGLLITFQLFKLIEVKSGQDIPQ